MYKEPQTCYIPDKEGEYLVEGRFNNTNNQPVKELPDRYIFTKEELEAQKNEWQREVEKRYENMELQIIELLSVSHCKNIIDVIEKFTSTKTTQ